MKLTLKLPSNRKLDSDFEPNTQIRDLRAMASSEIGIDPVQLNLVIEGKLLDDNATVGSVDLLTDGCEITIMTVVTA